MLPSFFKGAQEFFTYSASDFTPSQYGPPHGGSGRARQASHIPAWRQPSLRAPLEKKALVERLVRLAATPVPHTPKGVLPVLNPKGLANLQHDVEGWWGSHVTNPLMNVAETGIKYLPSKVQGTARKGARLIAEDPIGGTAANLVPVPGAFPAYLGAKKLLEKGIDRFAPLQKAAGLGSILHAPIGPGELPLVGGLSKALQGLGNIGRNAKPTSSAPKPMFSMTPTGTPKPPAPVHPIGGYRPMSPQAIMAHLDKQKVKPLTVTASALGHLKEAYQTSQYSGPLSYGGFPQVSQLPPFRAPSLRAPVKKLSAGTVKESSDPRDQMRIPQPNLNAPAVKPPSFRTPSMPPPVPKPPTMNAFNPKPTFAKFENMKPGAVRMARAL